MQKIAAANNPGEDAAVGWTGEEGGKFEQAVSKISNTIWPSENIFHLSRNLDSKLMFREMYAEYSHWNHATFFATEKNLREYLMQYIYAKSFRWDMLIIAFKDFRGIWLCLIGYNWKLAVLMI